jgi:hypothetical protein
MDCNLHTDGRGMKFVFLMASMLALTGFRAQAVAVSPIQVKVQCSPTGAIYSGTLSWDFNVSSWQFQRGACQDAMMGCLNPTAGFCKYSQCEWNPRTPQSATLTFNGVEYSLALGTQDLVFSPETSSDIPYCHTAEFSTVKPSLDQQPISLSAWNDLASAEIAEGDTFPQLVPFQGLCGKGSTRLKESVSILNIKLNGNSFESMHLVGPNLACTIQPESVAGDH